MFILINTDWWRLPFDNMPSQYIANFNDCKFKFQLQTLTFFLFFLKKNNYGYTLEPPHKK